MNFQHERTYLGERQNCQTAQAQAKNRDFQVEMKTVWQDHGRYDFVFTHFISDCPAQKNKQFQSNKKDQRQGDGLAIPFRQPGNLFPS